jgi:beta-lactamase regulating signal transducer with metallopeptidase domain
MKNKSIIIILIVGLSLLFTTAYANTTEDNTVAENVSDISKSVATKIGEVAKVLNVEVNEFVKSPVGLGASILIIYKLIGDEAIGAIKMIIWVPIYLILVFSIGMMAKTVYVGKKIAFTAKSYIRDGTEYKDVTGKKYTEPLVKIDSEAGFLTAVGFIIVLSILSIPTFIMFA